MVNRLVRDDRFRAVVGQAEAMSLAQLEMFSRMSEREQARIMELSRRAIENRDRRAAQELTRMMATNPRAFSRHTRLFSRLSVDSGLRRLSPRDRQSVIRRAIEQTNQVDTMLSGMIENQLHETDLELDERNMACQEECKEVALAEMALLLKANIAALSVVTATGPALPIALGIIMAEYFYGMYVIQENADLCLASCEGEALETFCESNAECAEDEWCNKGLLGIGRNECQPRGTQGDACWDSAECASGCCGYDFWQGPVWKTCIPEEECD